MGLFYGSFSLSWLFNLQALMETAVTRVVLPMPILVLPPIIMSFLEKYVPDITRPLLFQTVFYNYMSIFLYNIQREAHAPQHVTYCIPFFTFQLQLSEVVPVVFTTGTYWCDTHNCTFTNLEIFQTNLGGVQQNLEIDGSKETNACEWHTLVLFIR